MQRAIVRRTIRSRRKVGHLRGQWLNKPAHHSEAHLQKDSGLGFRGLGFRGLGFPSNFPNWPADESPYRMLGLLLPCS